MDLSNTLSTDADNAPANIDTTKLFMRSIARAAMNIDDDNPELEVVPIEEIGYVDGEMTKQREMIKTAGIDIHGNMFQTQIETSNNILATWLPTTNVVYCPNIRRGERVFLWQYGETDKYYWTAVGLDDNVRRLETIAHRISNTQDELDKSITPDNSYWFEWSTHWKHVTLKTSKNDGEKFKYTVQIDTKGNRVTICDDVGNYIELDSEATKITLKNADESHLILDKTNIFLEARDNITMTAKNIITNASKDTTMESGSNTNMKSGSATTVKAGSTMALDSGSGTAIKSPSVGIDSGSTSFGGGDTTIEGTYTVNGAFNFKGAVTSNGKDISANHTHKNSGGDGTGGSVS